MLSKKVVRTMKVINTTMNSLSCPAGTSEAWRDVPHVTLTDQSPG
jgi:hypothetical protein